MKVAITISKLLSTVGGAQKSAAELANNLSARGHSVSLVTFENPDDTRESFYHVDDKVKVIVVPRPDLAGVRGKKKKTSQQIWYAAHRQTLIGLLEAFLKDRPGLVVSFLPSTFTATYMALKDTGLPFVVANRSDPTLDYTIERYIKNEFDVDLRFKAVEGAVANLVQIPEYVTFFKDEVRAKTRVIPNPIDSSVDGIKPKVARKNIVTVVSRLEPVKNTALVIKAFAQIASKHLDWRLDIYGEGSEKEKLAGLIADKKLGEQIKLKGNSSSIQVKLREARIFVLPSYIEGFSRALGEAMTAGLPSVVLKECRSNAHLVGESRGGIATGDSPAQMAEALERLMTSEELREEMGGYAKEYTKKYRPERVYDLWEETVTELANSSYIKRAVVAWKLRHKLRNLD